MRRKSKFWNQLINDEVVEWEIYPVEPEGFKVKRAGIISWAGLIFVRPQDAEHTMMKGGGKWELMGEAAPVTVEPEPEARWAGARIPMPLADAKPPTAPKREKEEKMLEPKVRKPK